MPCGTMTNDVAAATFSRDFTTEDGSMKPNSWFKVLEFGACAGSLLQVHRTSAQEGSSYPRHSVLATRLCSLPSKKPELRWRRLP